MYSITKEDNIRLLCILLPNKNIKDILSEQLKKKKIQTSHNKQTENETKILPAYKLLQTEVIKMPPNTSKSPIPTSASTPLACTPTTFEVSSALWLLNDLFFHHVNNFIWDT